MKKNKGFTLIELLAVIVILAIIALIATPIIMNVINDSKKGAAKDAMFGYVKAVELATTKKITATTGAPTGTYIVTDGNLVRGTDTLTISFKGTKPKNNGTVTLVNGAVTGARLNFDNTDVSYDGNKTELGNIYPVGEEVYFDPTGAVMDCKIGKEWTPSNTGTTCYKWNVVKDNGNNIEMLLDHNTTGWVMWNSSGNSANGPKEVYDQLKSDTTSWSRVETFKSRDNVTINNGVGGTYTVDYNGMKARIMGAQEIADIGNDTVWSAARYTGTEYINYPWLYQNLSAANSPLQPVGYWTDSIYYQRLDYGWYVGYPGGLYIYSITQNAGYGVRPVVRVLKSNI